ncbi:hypothetical protein AMECASPLE_035771 [Ameca splendens]|uniref:Uncharacterized protein n=1 Tax=Ameca splendens TaxID=208324 RepID=A0ABV0ZSR3_9TELE
MQSLANPLTKLLQPAYRGYSHLFLDGSPSSPCAMPSQTTAIYQDESSHCTHLSINLSNYLLVSLIIAW